MSCRVSSMFLMSPYLSSQNFTYLTEFVDNKQYVSGIIKSTYIEIQDNPKLLIPANKTQPDVVINSMVDMTSGYGHYFSLEVRGYVRATTTGAHTFTLTSDDGSYMWFGDNAYNGALGTGTTGNAFINNGGLHGERAISNSISLVKGRTYPIWAYMFEHDGNHKFQIDCNLPIELYHIGTGWE